MSMRGIAGRVASLVLLLVVVAAILAITNKPAPGEPDGVQVTMQELDQNTKAAEQAIDANDWDAVAELSDKLAHHTQPPLSQKLRVVLWLGKQAKQFRGFDGQLKQAALAMGEAAQQQDNAGVEQSFAQLNQACNSCHEQFRADYFEHFYP